MYRKTKEHFSKKWMLVSLLALTSIVVVACFGIISLVLLTKEVNREITESEQVARPTSILKNYDVTYPVFHHDTIDRMLRNYVTHRVDTFWHELGDKRNDPQSYLTIKYTIAHYGQKTTTVVFTEQQRLLGASRPLTQTFMTFDLASQTLLGVKSLFKNEVVATMLLRRLFYDYFTNEKPGNISPTNLQKLAKFELGDIQNFIVTSDSLVVYLKSNLPIAVKKNLLGAALQDSYAAHDPAIESAPIDPPPYLINVMPRHFEPLNPNGKLLALTFDDGPGSMTPRLLDVLKQYHARATFFVIGRQVPGYAGVIKRMVTEGHEIGNHTWDHPNLTLLSSAALHQQIGQTQRVIEQVTGGYVPRVMRPPMGVINTSVSASMQALGLGVALWSIDTLDWLDRDAGIVHWRIMSGATDGGVILLHDIHPTSVEAAVAAIPELIAQGYQLVTWSELKRYRQ